MIKQHKEQYPDLGLLVLRLGIGIMFIYHGYGKLAGGPEMWEKLGSAMGSLGIAFGWNVWGLLATLAEFLGGIALVLGLFVRPAAFFLCITMLVATNMHLAKGDGLPAASHAIEDGIVFLSLLLLGSGRFSLDEKFRRKN